MTKNTQSIQKQKPATARASRSGATASTSSKYQLSEEDKQILRSTSWQSMIDILVDKK
jgi:hypothetical protein